MTAQSSEVVVIGNAGVDTNVYLAGDSIDWQHEANFTENLDMLGQAGGYASLGYVRMAKSTAFIGYVGEDLPGTWLRTTLQREDVDTHAMFIDPAGTARSVNIMYRDGSRKNFYDGKSHMQLTPDLAICAAVFSGARLAHFNIPNWARHLLPLARSAGARIAVDLQDLITLDDPYRQDFIQEADFIFFSAANQSDPAGLIHALLAGKPERVVVCGMGASGCAVGTRAGVSFYPPVRMDARPVVDTNGAGDALAVGFLCSYVLDGCSLEEAQLRGQIAARYTCGARHSSEKVIARARLDALVASISNAV